jgi:hypothetical protein
MDAEPGLREPPSLVHKPFFVREDPSSVVGEGNHGTGLHPQVVIEAKDIDIVPYLLQPALQYLRAQVDNFRGQVMVEVRMLIRIPQPLVKAPQPWIDKKGRPGIRGLPKQNLSGIEKRSRHPPLPFVIDRIVGVGPVGMFIDVTDGFRLPQRRQVIQEDPVSPHLFHKKAPHPVPYRAAARPVSARSSKDDRLYIAVEPLFEFRLQVHRSEVSQRLDRGRNPELLAEGIIVGRHDAAVGPSPDDGNTLRLLVVHGYPKILSRCQTRHGPDPFTRKRC